ncbi:MAG: Crp/Fnr family transcriptional regulator [Chloroflexia bacterium]
MDEKARSLKTTDLFQDLSEEELAALERRIPTITVPAGQLIYSPEERAAALFILKTGRVRLYRISPEGKSLTLAIVEPGAVFGELALLGEGMHDSFAEALEDSTIWTLSARDVQEVLLANPRIARRLLGLIGQRLTATERKLEDLAFKRVPARLATLLLELGRASAGREGNPVTLRYRYTHQQLAEMIGSYRETVTKVLNEFRDEGLIRVERGYIQLVDLAGLRRKATRS